MRKYYILGSIILLFGLVLAACSSSNNANGTTSPYPGPTSSSGSNGGTGNLPGTGMTNTFTSTETLPTQPITSTNPVTSSTSSTSTNPVTNTNPVTSTGTSTETVPSLGATNPTIDPGLLSNQMKFQIMDQQNNPLGQVQDMILDLTNLKVAYVIVARTASTGTGSSQPVAVPWANLQLQTTSPQPAAANSTPAAPGQPNASAGNTGQGEFVFKGDPQMLANAPAFDASMLPQFGISAGGWDSSIVSYWNKGGSSSTVSPTSTPASGLGALAGAMKLQGVFLASKVVGFSIKDTNGQQIATISDAVVDVNSGAITYVILTVNGKLVPVPVTELGIDLATQSVVLQSGAASLQNAPSFILGKLPLTTSSDWDAQIKSFWQSQMQPTKAP